MIKIRLLSLLCYLGFAPQLWLLGFKKERSAVLERHVNAGLVLSAFLLFSITFCVAVLLAEHAVESRIPLGLIVVQIVFTASAIPALIWALLTVLGAFQALRGSVAPLPIVSQLSRRRGVVTLSVCCGFLMQLAVLIPLRANYLVWSPDDSASVYLLYETTDYIQLTDEKTWHYPVPKWGVATMFYPISEFTVYRWGAGSVAVEPLTEANLTAAFQKGRFVVVSAHGGWPPGTISYSVDSHASYAPEDVGKNGGVGPNLQFVYINGCDVGDREDAWRESLGDVELVVFDRISFEQEHILWYVFKGPLVVLNLK